MTTDDLFQGVRHSLIGIGRSRNFKSVFRHVLMLLAIFVLTGTAAAEEFISREHGFKINFPKSPTVEISEKRIASGMIQIVRYKAKKKAFRTSLTVVTYSRDVFTGEEIKEALARSRDRRVKNMRGELLSDTDIAIDGHSGKELVIGVGAFSGPRIYRYRMRNYYVGNRQYLISIVGASNLVLSPKSDSFFNSFRLIGPTGDSSN